tara:strand:+ start:461 stop:706 length:246 start_codon:yes stop_codon:yes gene_type:complete
METQRFMGRGQLVPRLIEQVGNRDFAMNLLKDRGHMNPNGTLTPEGQQRNNMTAGERAHDRSNTTPHTHTYDSTTNTVKKN